MNRVISTLLCALLFQLAPGVVAQELPSVGPIIPFDTASRKIIGSPDFEKVRDFPASSQIRSLATGVGILGSNGHPWCTAFLIAPDLLMTNEHCVNSLVGVSCSDMSVYMDYYYEGIIGAPTANVEACETVNAQLDFALLRLDREVDEKYRPLKLDIHGEHLHSSTDVKIIQHPASREKEVSRVNSQIIGLWEEQGLMHYIGDTQPGSSGSPVFSVDGEFVIALHHAGMEQRNEGILMASIAQAMGWSVNALWRDLAALAEGGRPLTVRTNQTSYSIGEALLFTFDVPAAGYLNIINVDEQGEGTVLFPNEYDKQNRVEVGEIELPTQNMPFELTASAPGGKQLIVAVLTEEPINLFDQSGPTETSRVFARFDQNSARSISKASVRGEYWAGQLVTEIRP